LTSARDTGTVASGGLETIIEPGGVSANAQAGGGSASVQARRNSAKRQFTGDYLVTADFVGNMYVLMNRQRTNTGQSSFYE
jgi:hypothetical protein